jgi:hypothetical protein
MGTRNIVSDHELVATRDIPTPKIASEHRRVQTRDVRAEFMFLYSLHVAAFIYLINFPGSCVFLYSLHVAALIYLVSCPGSCWY